MSDTVHPKVDADVQLQTARRALTDAVTRARRQLAEDEEDCRRAQHELRLVTSSTGRRWFLTARGRTLSSLRLVVAPTRVVGWFVVRFSRLAARLTRGLDVADLVRFRSSALRFLPPIEQTTDQPSAEEAIRWLGAVEVSGRSRHALLAHPSSSVTFRVEEAAGTRLVAWAALLPHVWYQNPDGVEFVLSARSEDGPWQAEVRRHVQPRTRPGDRRWRRIRLDVPRDVSLPLLVTLTTRLREGARPDWAWAIWGEPSVQSARHAGEIVRVTRANVGQVGLRGTLAKMRDLSNHDEERARFRRWIDQHTPSADDLARMAENTNDLSYRPLISIITPVYNTEPRWLIPAIESVRHQVYPNWELCLADDGSTSAETVETLGRYRDDPRIKLTRLERNQGISAATNAALAQASGEFVAMFDSDDELPPDALYEVALYLNEHRDADFVYSDEDKLDMQGQRCDPYFKPDWSPDLFRSFMYTNHLMVIRRTLALEAGGFRVEFEGSGDYDLALRVSEQARHIGHIPKILYHWRKIPGSAAAEIQAKPHPLDAARRALVGHVARVGAEAEVLHGLTRGHFRVRYAIKDRPLVTIVVTTDDRTRTVHGRPMRLLTNCLRSIVQKTTYANYEILVVDNGRLSDESAEFLSRTPHRRVSYQYTGAFNFPHKLNFAARQVEGAHLVVFNDDLEVISPDWLSAMLEFSQQPDVGAVGARLLFPDGRLQHIGMVLGVCGLAAHAYHMAPSSSTGYAGNAIVVRNVSCVTGACMMTRRAIFDLMGGFNERLAIDFNDVDYCLRLRRAGYRVIYTPYAELYHLESGSFGGRQQSGHEMEEMRMTWGTALDADPYYNPNLTRDFPDFRIGS